MYSVFTGVLVFDRTVKFFVKGCFEAALYVTDIFPFSPGLTGVLVNSATEHPHDGFTSLIMMGSVPTFSKVKTWVTGVPCGILPKSWVSLSNLNSALLFCCASALVQTKATNATHIVAIFFIIVFLLVFVLVYGLSRYRDKQIYHF